MIELDIFSTTFDIEQGSFVVLFGESGVGKTTALRNLKKKYPDDILFPLPSSHGPDRWYDVIKSANMRYNIYLFDEPTNYGLDREVRIEIIQMLRSLHIQGNTIIMASHDWAANEYATRIVEMFDDKTVVDHGIGMFWRVL